MTKFCTGPSSRFKQDGVRAAIGSFIAKFKTLLLLEISLLMGCDLDWGTAHPAGAAGGGGGAADLLPSGQGNDDYNDSEDGNEGGGVGTVAAAPAVVLRRRGAAAAAAAPGGGGAPATAAPGRSPAAAPTAATTAAMAYIDPVDVEAAVAYAAAVDAGLEKAAPDMNNFLTWHPGTFLVLCPGQGHLSFHGQVL
jgi:hypothetical protein